MEVSNIETCLDECSALYYSSHPPEYTPELMFKELFDKFLQYNIRMAAEGRINDLIISINVPSSITNTYIVSVQEEVLGKIKRRNPGVTYDFAIAPFSPELKTYSLMLYKIF